MPWRGARHPRPSLSRPRRACRAAPYIEDNVQYFPPGADFPTATAGADPLVRTAYAAEPDGPPATIRVHAADGQLVVEHDGYGRDGAVTCTTLEIAAQSPEQAHAVAVAVRADGSPIVCWPFRNVGVGRAEPEPEPPRRPTRRPPSGSPRSRPSSTA